MRRFFASDIPGAGESLSLSGSESRHASQVLRLGVGEHITVLDGAGVSAEAVIAERCGVRRSERLACNILRRWEHCRPGTKIRLYVAPPRGKMMGQVVRDATELGVWRITPIICRFAVARPASGGTAARWRTDAIAAIKQSGNVFLPIVDEPCQFETAIAHAGSRGYFGAMPSADSTSSMPVSEETGEISVWIGPEGGFSEAEECALRGRDFRPFTLGAWTLRVETAVVALLGYLIGCLAHDDLRCECR